MVFCGAERSKNATPASRGPQKAAAAARTVAHILGVPIFRAANQEVEEGRAVWDLAARVKDGHATNAVY